MIAEDVDFDEVDDRAVGDAVVDVAEGSGEDESKGKRGDVDVLAKADKGDEHRDHSQAGEGDQSPAHGVGRGRVCEEREGRALIEPMGDAQETRHQGNGAANGNVRVDP